MNKELIKNLKETLEREKTEAEDSLKKFAKKDAKLAGDWDTKFPKFDGSNLEEAANEVEEYGNLLPLEFDLEIKLKNIEKALEKIKNGKYGLCEKCGKEISEERLNVSPEAGFCQNCK